MTEKRFISFDIRRRGSSANRWGIATGHWQIFFFLGRAVIRIGDWSIVDRHYHLKKTDCIYQEEEKI